MWSSLPLVCPVRPQEFTKLTLTPRMFWELVLEFISYAYPCNRKTYTHLFVFRIKFHQTCPYTTLTLLFLIVSELILLWCKLSCHTKLAAPKLTLTLPNLFRINAVQTYIYTIRNGQSTVGRPKWTKMDHFGPFWSRECQNPVRNKVILTKMVVWTILVQYTFRQYRGHSLTYTFYNFILCEYKM